MNTTTKIILAIIFSIIVCTDIITYIIKVEKLEIKTEKRLFFFQTLSKVLFMCLITIMFQLIVKIFETLHSA
jgi:hypothetical protein|nr:MAG TPA: hypothetical protein [Crassvirales sp.]